MNLNLYQIADQYKIKKIFKNVLKSKKNFIQNFIGEYIMKYSNSIARLSLELINRTLDESIIFMIEKIIRYIIEDTDGLKCILNFEFFLKIFTLTKNKKFVFSSEAFKILCVFNL